MKKTVCAILILIALFILAIILIEQPAHAESITVENKSGKSVFALNHASQILGATRQFLLNNGYAWARADVGDLKIVVFETRGDLNIFLQRNFPGLEGVVACYDIDRNIIYTFPGVKPHYLAHEFTHVLVERAGIKIEKGHKEDLPVFVDEHINLNWIW